MRNEGGIEEGEDHRMHDVRAFDGSKVRENIVILTGGNNIMGKSLEHPNCKVKKETATRAVASRRRFPSPAVAVRPSILTEGKNGRRMLYNVQEEPVVGGRNPLKKKVSRDWVYIVILTRGVDACYRKSLEHPICKVKKETGGVSHRRPPPPPSIYTVGQNVRRMLCDVYNVHDEPVVGGGTPII